MYEKGVLYVVQLCRTQDISKNCSPDLWNRNAVYGQVLIQEGLSVLETW